MVRTLCIVIMLLTQTHKAQQSSCHKLSPLTVDDKAEGYTIFSYKIPADGYFTFSLTGAMLPARSCTIYYCEYRFQLRSSSCTHEQSSINIGSQAQDGNECNFTSNQKDFQISAPFHKDEIVELRILLNKSEVNGAPHQQLKFAASSKVSVKMLRPDISFSAINN